MSLLSNSTLLIIIAAIAAVLGVSATAANAAIPAKYSIAESGRAVKWGGVEYYPIDSSGVFYYDSSQGVGCPMPDPGVGVQDILNRNGFHGVVRCKLTDYVDCTGKTHGFKESGDSRVLELNGEQYRVTLPAGKLSWFSYELATNAKPGKPHIVVCQLINDRERYTAVTLNHDRDLGWAAPYQGEEKHEPKSQEGNSWQCDVGSAIYTGREYYCDGKAYTFVMPFYPKNGKAKITISHRTNEYDFDERNGAAVARIWMFDILDPLPDAVPDDSKFDHNERKLALYMPHPWFLYSQFGIPPRTEEWRKQSMWETANYMKFCGFNQLQLHIINGSDRASCAWYDSKMYPSLEGNIFKEFLPVAEREGIEMVPIVAPLQSPFNGKPGETSDQPNKDGWSRDSALLDYTGQDFSRAFGNPAPNPLRPEVQEWMLNCLRESLDRCSQSPAVPAVGFRVNGKIGLCFPGERPDMCGQQAGYDRWSVGQFSKDTGIQVPWQDPTPYEYIRANCWDQWLQWRCDRTRDFWLKCRDLVKSYRPDLDFIAACDLPSESPGYNIEWPSGDYTIRDLFRHHGYDPELYKNDKGIWIQRGMMVGSDRYWHTAWFPYEKNSWAHKMFNYAQGVAESYETPDSSSVELYHNYWEEDPHPDPEYGMYMRTGTPVAYGDFYYEPAVFSLRKVNVDRVVLMGWERACAGHEHDLRRFARAFRAIPKGNPKEFDGKITVVKNGPQLSEDKLPHGYKKPEMDVLDASWFGDKLAIVNDAFCPRTVKVSLKSPLKKGQCVYEYGAGRIICEATVGASNDFTLELHPFDLQVVSVIDKAAADKLMANIPQPKLESGVALDVVSGGKQVVAGSDTEFSIKLTNGTKSAIEKIVLNVNLPEGWKEASGDERILAKLGPGQSYKFKVRAAVSEEQAGNTGTIKASAMYKGAGSILTVEANAVAYASLPVQLGQKNVLFTGCSGETVKASITGMNLSDKPITGDINMDLPSGWRSGSLSGVTLAAGETSELPLDITIADSASARRYKTEASFSVGNATSEPVPVVIDIAMRCPRATSAPVIDSKLTEWPENAVVINSNQFRMGENADAVVMEALKPQAWFSWDEDNLYIAAKTANTDYKNSFSGGEIWKGDSLQFGIDPHRSITGVRGFYEYVFTGDSNGIKASRLRALDEVYYSDASNGRFAARTDSSGTIYETAIKWADLGFVPKAGETIGIALVINDFDGSKRRVVTFAEGLADSKDQSKFIALRLEK